MRKKEIITLIILLAFVVLLRIPSLFEPYWYGDEGITLTVGQTLRNGGILYKDIADNKTPLIYYLAAIFETLPKLRFLLFVWMTATTAFFYLLAKHLLKSTAILISTLIFSILASTPIMEGNIANGEIFQVLPNIIGIILAWQAIEKENSKLFFYSGIFFGIGFLFKPPTIFDLTAVIFFLFFIYANKLKQLFSKILVIFLGFCLPNAIMLFYFYLNNNLIYYWEYAFKGNFSYSLWNNFLIIPYGSLILRAGFILIFLINIILFRKYIPRYLLLVILWFLFSLFGSLLSARYYIHYFIQVIPAFSLLAGSILNFRKKLCWIVLAAAILFWNFNFPGSFKYQYEYYVNFGEYIGGRKTISAYRNFFDQNVNTTYKVADFLKTAKRGPIFIWSDNSLIYPLAKRGPVGKFSAAYNIVWSENRKNETMSKLKTVLPIYVIVSNPVKYPYPELDKFIASNYNFLKIIDNFEIYERKS